MHDLSVKIDEKVYTKDGVPLVLLKGLMFTAKPGRITVILGESGCGKSTLLRIIVGLDQNFDGSVSLPKNTHAKTTVSMVFQDTRLLPWKTVRENIRFAAQVPSLFSDHEIERLLRTVRLADAIDSFPKDLSGGMAQRVALARALVENPATILLDEPFSSLDSFTRNDLQAELRRIVDATGVVCIFVTHDLDEAIFLADDLVTISMSNKCNSPMTEVDLAHPRDRLGEGFARERSRVGKLLRATMLREAK